MMNRENAGYLLDSKQIIAYAEWYLNNPIALQSDYELSPYSEDDIKATKAVIQKAKRNPKMVAFRIPTFNAVFGDNVQDGFTLETGMSLPKRIADTMSSVYDTDLSNVDVTTKQYLNYLKKQKVVSFDKVVEYAKQADKKFDQKANLFNKLITKTAKNSKKRIQYKKFINNAYTADDVLREYIRSQNYTSNDDMLASEDMDELGFHNNKIMTKPSIQSKKWTPVTDNKVNAYFKIAMYAKFKCQIPYININNFNPAKCFASDINADNLSVGYNYVSAHSNSVEKQADHEDNVTDPHKMIDYRRFVLNK